MEMTTLAPHPPPGLEPRRLDERLRRLHDARHRWVRTGIPERLAHLRLALEGALEVAGPWVEAACRAKGLDPHSPAAGEEWLGGPMTVVRHLRLMVEALKQEGRPRVPALRTGPDGRVVAKVFPTSFLEGLLYHRMQAEVWIQPGKPATQGRIYREKAAGRFPPGRVCLVLGAGNVSSIAPLDVLYKMFVEDQVVVLKANPVNAYLGPFLERMFASLVREDFLMVTEGGAETGAYLAEHPLVDTIHLTGSEATHDAIVWGADPGEQLERKRAGRPRLTKPVTSELGCVTPVVVVPGDWSRGDLLYHAQNVASMVVHNASFNCNAAKLLVLPEGWGLREAFVESLKGVFASLPSRKAYYPGARDRFEAFLEAYPGATLLTGHDEDEIPWTLAENVEPRKGEPALTHEAFCGVLAETRLPGGDAESFLRRAVAVLNESVWGSLSCVVLVDPRSQRSLGARFERFLADLRYGGIAVNVWSGVNFSLGVTTWGAYPGHPLDDIQSGRGVVHNAFLFDHPEKSVVRGPFRIRPKPVWFATHRQLHRIGRLLTRYEAHPTLGALARIGLAGLRG